MSGIEGFMLKHIYSKYRILIHNILYMNTVKIIVLIVPLLVYPYLIRVVGAEKFGLVLWIWTIIDLFIVCLNFGFDISITKHISIHRNSIKHLSKIYSSVLYLKLIFFIISIFVLYVMYEFIDKFHTNSLLFLFSSLMIFPELLMPLWYFRGLEKMQFIAFLTTSTKLLFALSVFYFIQERADYIYIPLLYGISGLISAFIANYIVLIYHKIGIVKVRHIRMVYYFNESLPLFASNSFFIIREKAGIILIEKFFGLSFVAYWDMIGKIINMLTMPFQIVSSSFYPYMARVKDLKLLIKILILTMIPVFVIIVIVNIYSENIIYKLLNTHSLQIETVLIILSFSIIFNVISAFIGLNILSVYSKNFYYFLSSFLSTIVYFSIFYYIYFEKIVIDAKIFTIIVVFSIFIEMMLRIIFSLSLVRKKWKLNEKL